MINTNLLLNILAIIEPLDTVFNVKNNVNNMNVRHAKILTIKNITLIHHTFVVPYRWVF